MAFLSLGLHSDEPSTTSDQGKNESPRELEGKSSAHEFGSFQPPKGSANGNGHVLPESTQELDGFEADHFDDEVDPSDADKKLKTWISGADQQ